MTKRELFLRFASIILFIVGVGQLAISQIHIAATTKIFANQIGIYLFLFIIFGLTTGINAVLIEKPMSLVSFVGSSILGSWGGIVYLRLLQADVIRQEQLTMADVNDSFRIVAASIVIYLVGAIIVSVLSWPDVKKASALNV
ncbi:MAG: hypothetical protein AAF614_19445 [Chloroflexota bacterium]